ncbi:MAG: alkaline phosphatase family protein [Planctomycetota bacterium]
MVDSTLERAPRLAVLILDAADASLVESCCEDVGGDGGMPNLKRLRDRGVYGRIGSVAAEVNAAPWPSFMTGKEPGDHGVWNYVGWDPMKMNHRACGPEHENYEPWWRGLCREGCRSVILDVPRTYPPEAGALDFEGKPNGVELSAWGSHYKLTNPYSEPAGFLKWLEGELGRPDWGNEPGGELTADMVLKEKARVMKVIEMQGEAGVRTLGREACELFVLAFSGPHRGGHVVWDDTGLADKGTPDQRDEVNRSIHEVYSATDRELGRVLDRLAELPGGDETVVWALSLHGMTQNESLAQLLPEMLDRVLHDKKVEPVSVGEAEVGKPKKGLLKTVREMVPESARSAVKDRLPLSVQNWLTRFWRKTNVDWSQTEALALLDDLQGFVLINLKGREAKGIVEPGEAYEALCAKITDGLKTFVHVDTGEPAVRAVDRPGELYPNGTKAGIIPDLIVQWAHRPVVTVQAIESERYGRIDWPTPGRVTDGRSGHHVGEGWWVAAGPGLEAGGSHAGMHALDVVPTIYRQLGRELPAGIAGEAREELVARAEVGVG